MIVAWARHTGEDDPEGAGVVNYLCNPVVRKPSPDGSGRVLRRRDPPPEILRGDPGLMRQAIRAVDFKRKYSSAVLSFERGDVDIARFNSGDSVLREQIDGVMRAFESAAFAGIAEEHRPPCLWTTHTDTGRLELNFCTPRAILSGDGRIKSINPSPPGAANRAIWDAFRDVMNCRYGWADPEDPRRARLAAVPDWIAKIAAGAERAGETTKKNLATEVAALAEAAFAAGEIHSRTDLIEKLRAKGVQIPRVGRDYITLVNAEGKRVRVRGRLFSESFVSREAFDPLSADAAPRLVLDECVDRLNGLVNARAKFHRLRYGGPEWEVPAVPPPNVSPIPTAIESPPITSVKSSAAIAKSLCNPSDTGDAPAADLGNAEIEAVEPDPLRKARYKARLFLVIFGMTLPDELLMALRRIDRTTRTVRLVDGAVVTDHGERISASKTSQMAVKLMIAEAQAKGWAEITVKGSPEFQRLAVVEAVRAGIAVASPELRDLFRQEEARWKELKHGQFDPDGARIAANHLPDPGGVRGAGDGINAAARRLNEADGFLGVAVRRAEQSARRRVNRPRQGRPDLARIKTEVDLRAVAARLGFLVDERASDRNHIAMRHPDGTKLIVGMSAAGHRVFSSNAGRQGTAIDLLQWRTGATVAEAASQLQSLLGAPPSELPELPAQSYPAPRKATGNTEGAAAEWREASVTTRCAFLEQERGISAETLAAPRFRETFRVDGHHNAVFPYHLSGGLVGVERRNRPAPSSKRSFRAYTAGALPGMWMSRPDAADGRLVVVESPIDAMAHYELSSPDERTTTRYLAIRNGIPHEELRAVMARLPTGMMVVSACDNDAAGRAHAEKIKVAAIEAGRDFTTEAPPAPAGDWNEALRQQQQLAFRSQSYPRR